MDGRWLPLRPSLCTAEHHEPHEIKLLLQRWFTLLTQHSPTFFFLSPSVFVSSHLLSLFASRVSFADTLRFRNFRVADWDEVLFIAKLWKIKIFDYNNTEQSISFGWQWRHSLQSQQIIWPKILVHDYLSVHPFGKCVLHKLLKHTAAAPLQAALKPLTSHACTRKCGEVLKLDTKTKTGTKTR